MKMSSKLASIVWGKDYRTILAVAGCPFDLVTGEYTLTEAMQQDYLQRLTEGMGK